jgi:hypothetical protein
MTLTELENAFGLTLAAIMPARELVKGRVGDAAVPATPYVMYEAEDITLPDSPVVSISDDETTQTVSAVTPVTFLLNFVGGNAQSDAVRFSLALRLSQRTADLWKVCGLWGVSQIIDLSAVENGTMRARAEVRVTLSATLHIEHAAELIETVDIEITEPQSVYDMTITVNEG